MVKMVNLTVLFFLVLVTKGQQNEVTSFYFTEAQPSGTMKYESFGEEVLGKYYYKDDSLTQIFISFDSIYAQQILLVHLLKSELDTSTKYSIKNSKLYGVKLDQGIPCALRNDTIFAALVQHNLIFKPSADEILKKVDDLYFLNFKQEHGYFSTLILRKNGDELSFEELDHDLVIDEITKFKNIKTTELDGFKTYLASPSSKEIINLIQNEGFKDKTWYIIAN